MLRRETHLKVQTLYTRPDKALEVILGLAMLSIVQSAIIILLVLWTVIVNDGCLASDGCGVTPASEPWPV